MAHSSRLMAHASRLMAHGQLEVCREGRGPGGPRGKLLSAMSHEPRGLRHEPWAMSHEPLTMNAKWSVNFSMIYHRYQLLGVTPQHSDSHPCTPTRWSRGLSPWFRGFLIDTLLTFAVSSPQRSSGALLIIVKGVYLPSPTWETLLIFVAWGAALAPYPDHYSVDMPRGSVPTRAHSDISCCCCAIPAGLVYAHTTLLSTKRQNTRVGAIPSLTAGPSGRQFQFKSQNLWCVLPRTRN